MDAQCYGDYINYFFSFFVIGVDVNQPLLEAYKHILL